MATYIVLLRFTMKGIKTIKEAPKRVEAAKQICRSQGAEVKALYFVMGQYDLVVILEAPDDQTVAEFGLALGALGNVQTETLRAFTEDEYSKIIAMLP